MKIFCWVGLFFILAGALLARLWVAGHHPFIFDDSQDYLALARTVIDQRDFQVHGLYAIRMPGYPVFLVPMLFFFQSQYSVLVVQAILGALCCGVVYLMGRRISVGTGLLGAALLAVDPLQVAFSAAVLSEIPFTLVFLMGLWVALRLAERDRIWLWAALGVLWGLAVYLRGSVFWLVIPVGLWVVYVRDRDGDAGSPGLRYGGRNRWGALGRGLCGVMLAFAVMCLVLLPWNLRNTARFGPHSWLTTLEGISLYEAVYPEADGGPRQDKITTPEEMAPMGEAARNEEWARRAWGYIRAEPLRIVRLAFVKVGRTWSPWLNAAEFQGNAAQGFLGAWSVATDGLALVGLFSRRIPRGLRGIIVIPLLYFTALHAVFLGSVRYRVPILPLVDLLAAAGAMQVWAWVRRRPLPTMGAAAGQMKEARGGLRMCVVKGMVVCVK